MYRCVYIYIYIYTYMYKEEMKGDPGRGECAKIKRFAPVDHYDVHALLGCTTTFYPNYNIIVYYRICYY